MRKRDVLEVLTKSTLVQISQDLGFTGFGALNKPEIIDQLSRKRSIKLMDILSDLGITDLRIICSKLDLNMGGVSKQVLIDRIVGDDVEVVPKPKEVFKPPKVEPVTPATQQKPSPTKVIAKKPTPSEIKTNLKQRKKTEMAANGNDLENRLWAVANKLWADTGLGPAQFSTPVLGLIFLRYAESKFKKIQATLGEGSSSRRASDDKTSYIARGAIYLPNEARFSYLQNLPEGQDLGKAINEAMKLVEQENEDLRGVLPKTYTQIEDRTLVELLKLLGPVEIDGDAFGKVYEYFLGKFAMNEGRKGGVFYTPTSLVKLIVEIIEPYSGKIFDPACGSGGMFVQSDRFVKRHNGTGNKRISVYGTEKEQGTIRLSKMNLAVHGLAGDIREANTYYEDPHKSLGKFDFVMANPPFNVSGVDKERLEKDQRFSLGLPSTDNANYLWIQIFYSSLNEKGRAGFVMANSAADARATELEIRKKLIQEGAVDVIVSIGPNFFYTVTLPCTLWFFDKGKDRKDKVLFLDARHIYQQVDRAHRDFSPDQIEFLANIVRLYRGEDLEFDEGSKDLMTEYGIKNKYIDVAGLCKVASIKEIEAQGWSLNPGRYVGVADREDDGFDFKERLLELNEELEALNVEASELEGRIAENVIKLLEVPL